jgi:tol-pal system protein YbgF
MTLHRSRTGAAALWAIAAVVALAAAPARAALFEDDDARKAILELRAKVDRNDEQARARQAEASAQVAALTQQIAALNEQLAVLRRSVLELNNGIETLRAEVARMRGQDEQIARDLAEVQRRLADTQSGVEDRIRKLEPQKVAIDGKEFLADPDEKRQFEEALAAFRRGDFDRTVQLFILFQRRYVGSGYKESTLFWLGNAHYARRDYKEAMASFRALVTAAPEHPKAPEALLAIANCQVELKDGRSARRTIDELIKAYPGSEAAAAGRERLASIK